jgi:predicted dehydrogenase
MSPIRVAIVGLGKEISPTMQGSWAIIAHLPYLIASPLYEIVAVCNSSVASAEASIASNKIGPNVKAYGSVEDLAKDPNVDLAVVTVHVAKHYQLAKPLIAGGKNSKFKPYLVS